MGYGTAISTWFSGHCYRRTCLLIGALLLQIYVCLRRTYVAVIQPVSSGFTIVFSNCAECPRRSVAYRVAYSSSGRRVSRSASSAGRVKLPACTEPFFVHVASA